MMTYLGYSPINFNQIIIDNIIIEIEKNMDLLERNCIVSFNNKMI